MRSAPAIEGPMTAHFSDWLNFIDAVVDYEERRKMGIAYWKRLFDGGYSERQAIEYWQNHPYYPEERE